MIQSTRGIVLHSFKYGDTSIICNIYTESHGKIPFLIQGARKHKAKLKANLFQPFFLLDLEIYYKEKRQLQKIKEARNAYPFESILYDDSKRSIAIFLAEVLNKTIQSEDHDKQLFEFVFNHIKILDLKEKGLANFHLYFLVHFTKFLGFYPQNNFNADNKYFDLKNGYFAKVKPFHKNHLDEKESEMFHEIMKYSKDQHENLHISPSVRKKLLNKIIDFYYLHHSGNIHFKSYQILKEVF
ncbi:MAG: DNA repair protein RecO, partial [Bacteroidota bacterium]